MCTQESTIRCTPSPILMPRIRSRFRDLHGGYSIEKCCSIWTCKGEQSSIRHRCDCPRLSWRRSRESPPAASSSSRREDTSAEDRGRHYQTVWWRHVWPFSATCGDLNFVPDFRFRFIPTQSPSLSFPRMCSDNALLQLDQFHLHNRSA